MSTRFPGQNVSGKAAAAAPGSVDDRDRPSTPEQAAQLHAIYAARIRERDAILARLPHRRSPVTNQPKEGAR